MIRIYFIIFQNIEKNVLFIALDFSITVLTDPIKAAVRLNFIDYMEPYPFQHFQSHFRSNFGFNTS